jgi:hypothetical protein
MSEVPCNGCTACCKNDVIFLRDEDNPKDYDTVWTIHRSTGIGGLALKRKENGHCIYLIEDKGCSIHGRAPYNCRIFDCRKTWRDYLSLPRPQRRRLMKELQRQHLFGGEVVAAAKARMHTLE